MEPHENKQLALQKALNAHEQAASALTDLTGEFPGDTYAGMIERIDANMKELNAELARSHPGDHV
jgi:hypothetical protein